YQPLLQAWVSLNKHHRHLYGGNYTGRILENPPATTQSSGDSEREEQRRWREEERRARSWTPQEIIDQIQVTRETPGAQGNVHFSMKVFQRNPINLDEALLAGPYTEQALPP